MNRRNHFAALMCLLLLAMSASMALAWPPDGVVVAPIPPPGGQFEPRVLLGMEGSVLAFWSDGRWYDGGFDVYAQLLTRFGRISPGWPDTGLMVVRAPQDQRPTFGMSHPDGSFIVGFGDNRNFFPGSRTDSYLTRILPDGRIDPAWPRHGFRAVERDEDELPYRMAWVAPDTLVFASGYQRPNTIVINSAPLLQRIAITPYGPEQPWGPAGILYDWRPLGVASTLELTPDGAGGAYVLFDEYDWDNEGLPGDIYMMRVGRDGAPAPGWGPEPFPVGAAPGHQEFGSMCEDGAGGVYVAWADARDGAGLSFPEYEDYFDIRLQRMTPGGDVHPGWPAEGLLVSDAPGFQYRPAVTADGAGGVYVAFDDITIGLTRVQGDATFAPGWAKNGIQISTLNAYCTIPRMVRDAIGGVYVLFDDASNNDVRLQHVMPWGTVDPVWPAASYLASPARDGDFVSDGEGGCYVTSRRSDTPGEPFNSLIFVTRYSLDGVVPVKLAEATVEAEAGRVSLVWHGAATAASQVQVQRRAASADLWLTLGSPVARGRDELAYEDLTVVPGGRYAYRLILGGTEVLSEEQWVDVPAVAVFSLSGAQPNPALAHELTVAFTLSGHGRTSVEVLDVAGRREHTRPLDGLTPGRHVLSLADARLAPGIHWLRLSEGTRVAHSRFVVVR